MFIMEDRSLLRFGISCPHNLHFVEGTLPFTYLGVPIFQGRLKVHHLQPIADNIIGKFDRWSGSLLSMASRICLVNSIIVSFLTHSMMVYKWPRHLIKSVDVAMQNFVWNGNINKRNYGTVAWSRACAQRAKRGLGIHSIRGVNEGYLLKFAWDLLTRKDDGLAFIKQRHTTASGQDAKYFISSSIWGSTERAR